MISRRESLALLGAVGLTACVGPQKSRPPLSAPARPEPSNLHLEPLTDLVSGVDLEWVVQARPQEILSNDTFRTALDRIITPAKREELAQRYGGVDWTTASELVVAGYTATTLVLARVAFDPTHVEEAFARRAVSIEGRADEGGVRRFWGTVDGEREQVAIFGRAAIGIEHGALGPLRPAVYFAEGKLHRALPALRTEPLSNSAMLLGDAPLRAFAPGPFPDPWAAGFGGLLRASTAAAAAGRVVPRPDGSTALGLNLALGGNWGADATAAANRFGASFQRVTQDPLGYLLGLDRLVMGPTATGSSDALELTLTLDPIALARGLRAATAANLPEILGLSAAH